MKLSQQQLQFFETFGYLHFPSLMKEEVGWIIGGFRIDLCDQRSGA